ncbi:hypothetical protein [Shewanella woodyi]|uniref:Uncharacterized protein n=1 Tax=Shewanella woodyi (strain ATCC 51908 / MS32) TaxID=392500 RepID=B1KQG8_SHEWM|nr:hypothetical protein [Shewanella woodyi]ACA86207.1 hypothetical protein Swoo_1923 [Shewanella woodyi ATCC 51908]
MIISNPPLISQSSQLKSISSSEVGITRKTTGGDVQPPPKIQAEGPVITPNTTGGALQPPPKIHAEGPVITPKTTGGALQPPPKIHNDEMVTYARGASGVISSDADKTIGAHTSISVNV